MSNSTYNGVIVLLGFCLISLPIIFISLGTAPPPITQFQSTINLETIPGDIVSEEILVSMKNINGSTPDLFDEIISVPQLANINNISELILAETEFMSNYSIDVYTGFSKEVHLFILDMVITTVPSINESKDNFMELFGGSNGTMLSYMYSHDDWHSYYIDQPSYPSVNETIETFHANFDYMITISFFADLDINGTQTTTSFERLVFVDDFGIVFFFLTNEVAWETK